MLKFFRRKKPKATPLHYAAAEGNTVMVEKLLSQGAKVNAKDEQGSTPMDQALYWILRAQEGGSRSRYHEEVVAILKKHGGRANVYKT